MSYDWHGLFNKLSKPWWGPYAPYKYVTVSGKSAIGVGLLVGTEHWDYGAWNLALLERGSYVNPSTEDGHRELFMNYQNARRVANMAVEKQPLGSYTMLLQPAEFHSWLKGLPKPSMPKQAKQLLLLSVERLIDNAKELNTP